MKRVITLSLLICGVALALLLPGTMQAYEGGHTAEPSLFEHAWEGLRPATCMPDFCFCERIHPGVIRQPVNTWSNLAFVLVGLAVLASVVKDFSLALQPSAANPMRARWVYPTVYGAATVLIGVGSIFYHSSLAFAGQAIDIISMYLLTSFMILYNLSRLRRMSGGAFVASYVVANIILGAMSMQWPFLRRYIFVALALGVLISELVVCFRCRPRMDFKYFAAALVSLALAAASWILDITRIICSPDSWFQGHAMWHVMMAAVCACVFLYYRSETAHDAHPRIGRVAPSPRLGGV